jgi:cytochrome P450
VEKPRASAAWRGNARIPVSIAVEEHMPEIDDRPETEFLLTDPVVAKDPGAFFADLRQTCPIVHTDAHGGFWMVSRYDDVYAAALDAEALSSARGVTIPPAPFPPVPCLEQDEPGHRLFRRPLQSWFSAGRTAKLEDSIRAIVIDLIDQIIDDGHGDIAAAVAEPVPPIVIAMTLGLPREDWPWFRERTNKLLELSSAGDLEGSGTAVSELFVYLAEKLAERRAHPTDDLMSGIVDITVDGVPISAPEAVSLTFLILAAGHETTVGAIGGMLRQIAGDTSIRDELRDDPTLIPAAVEEALRLEPPLMGLGRTSSKNVTLGGVTVPEAERVMLLFGAANRDESVFVDAEQFRLDRDHNRHLSFGVGIHRCLGAPLARLEMRVILEEVLRRMPDIHIEDVDAVQVDYHFARVYTQLPVSW